MFHESARFVFHNVFPWKWQDEYNPIDLFSQAPRSVQASQAHPKPISNDGEHREVEVLRMVEECFSKYDCLNFDENKIEPTIHYGLGDALVDDPKKEDGFPLINPEGSNEDRE